LVSRLFLVRPHRTPSLRSDVTGRTVRLHKAGVASGTALGAVHNIILARLWRIIKLKLFSYTVSDCVIGAGVSPLTPSPPITGPFNCGYSATPPPKVMMPPGTKPRPVPCALKVGLNGLELLSPYKDPPGCVGLYKLAVDRGNKLLLKPFAVPAFAIAISLLPGHGSAGPPDASGTVLFIAKQSVPTRSTTANHIMLELKMPPFLSG